MKYCTLLLITFGFAYKAFGASSSSNPGFAVSDEIGTPPRKPLTTPEVPFVSPPGNEKKPKKSAKDVTLNPFDGREIYGKAAQEMARKEYHHRLLYEAYIRAQAEKARKEYHHRLLYEAYLAARRKDHHI